MLTSKPAKRSPERKLQVVLSVLRGEVSAAEAAPLAGVAEQTVHNWKNAFLTAGGDGSAQVPAVGVRPPTVVVRRPACDRGRHECAS